MDPFSLATGIVGLVTVALQLVTGALGMIDKTIADHDEAAAELEKLQEDLEDLQARMSDIHTTLKVLASNTKDRAFKKMLRKYASKQFTSICGPSLTCCPAKTVVQHLPSCVQHLMLLSFSSNN